MSSSAYQNFLSIEWKHKGVPYGGQGEVRPDGDANYGFKDIKGNSSLLLEIPELQRDAALMELVRAINQSSTGLFSVGCVSADVSDKQGHRCTGYVEFAINSVSEISDARNYFPLFFHFDRILRESKFPYQVNFNWELQPVTFIDAKASGFTCSIFINTHYSTDQEEARGAWRGVLDVLAGYLASFPCTHDDLIYRPA